MNARPLHDPLLVRRIEGSATAKGGTTIPDTAREKPRRGKVLAVGNGKIRHVDRMPSSTWTLWFLAGGLATVGLGVLLAPSSQDERDGGGEDVQETWEASERRTRLASWAS